MKKLKITSLILVVIMVVSMLPLGMISAWAAENAAQPDFTISSADEFVTFINNWYGTENYYKGKTVVLTADIDLTSTTLPDIKADKNSFTGTFDGQGHKIVGFDMVVPYGNDNHGVFGSYVAEGASATIKNVEIALAFDGQDTKETAGDPMAPHAGSGDAVKYSTTWGMGGLYGGIAGTLTVENVKLTGTTHGRSIGGIAQAVGGDAVVNMTNVDVGINIGHHWSGIGGGFFGEVATGATVYAEGCTYSGVFSYLCTDMGTDAPPQIGGFIGKNNSANVTFNNCEMSGTVISYLTVINYKKNTTTMNNQSHYIGGFVGLNEGVGAITFTDSVVSGTVKANVDTTVDTSAASKDTVAPHVGGFVAMNKTATNSVTFTRCTMSGDVISTYQTGATGWNHIGGFVGNSYGTAIFTDSVMSGNVDYDLIGASTGGHAAGFLGQTGGGDASFDGCVMGGTVTVQPINTGSAAGGFVGNAQGSGSLTIENSVMYGSLTTAGKGPAGGFFGTTTCGTTMNDCMMLGSVTATYEYATSDTGVGRTAGIGATTGSAAATFTNVVFYGSVSMTYLHPKAYATGFISGPGGTNTTVFTGCIYAGSVTGKDVRPTYINGGNPTGIYNAQIGGSHNGPANQPNEQSLYTMLKDTDNKAETPPVDISTPYGFASTNKMIWNKTSLSKAKYAASIDALTTSTADNTDAFAAEKTDYKKYLEDNYVLTTQLPIPKGCVETAIILASEEDMLWFATTLNSGFPFTQMTIKMDADVTFNKGWTASATLPEGGTAWPVGSGKTFAGIFDGQGHTISGIYLATTGDYVGIFGNVAQGTRGTVKNVAIVNSYVTTNCSGNKGGLGGIFGQVEDERATSAGQVTDPNAENKTKAIVDNVYADIMVVNTGNNKSSNLGTGGIIGGARADVSITNTAFVGTVNGGSIRGTAAFIGATRPLEASSKTYFRTVVTIQNCYAEATLSDAIGFVGGVVGYSNSATTYNITNVISNSTITSSSEGKCGYILGCTYWANGSPLAASMDPNQYWNMTDVYYVATTFKTTAGATKTIYPVGHSGNSTNADGSFKTGYLKFNGQPIMHDKTYADLSASGLAPTALKSLPEVLYAWNISGMNVTLTDDLAVNLYVDKTYTILNAASTVEDNVKVTTVGDEYKFTYANILPQQIGDDFVVELGASDVTVNVKEYLVKLLADEDAKHVAADLLRYGAAAQKYEDPSIADTDLVTYDLTLTGLGSTVDVAAMNPANPVLSADCTITGVALRLENSLALIARDENGNKVATTYLNADQMDEALTLTAEDGSTVQVSVAWYVKKALSGAVTEANDLALIRAIYAYGLSAADYAGK